MSQHRGRITRRTDDRKGWRFEIDTTDPRTGKRKRIVRSGFETKKEAQQALDELVGQRRQGRNLGRSPMLGEWFDNDWLPAAAATVRPTTARLYETTVRAYVSPHLAGLKLDEVTPAHLTALYGTLSDTLAPKTVRNVHGLIHRAFRDAVRWGMLIANPADAADPPRVPRKEPAIWNASQLRTFLEFVTENRLGALWRLAATTGMRRGELLGLRWIDVDLDRAHLAIVQQRTEYAGEQFESEPKTPSARRRVALDGATVVALRELRRRQLEERLAWGEGYEDHGLVFSRENGSPIRPAWLSRQLPTISADAGLPRLTPHGLRHSWATVALEQGVHPKVVSSRLGHASVQVTLDRYSHVGEGMDRDAADVVASFMDSSLG